MQIESAGVEARGVELRGELLDRPLCIRAEDVLDDADLAVVVERQVEVL